jgi:hypothetical protein
MIEGVFLLPIIVMIVIAIAWFSRVLITRQQLLIAARYGTDLISSTTLNEQEIRREVKTFLTHHWIKGRRLDPEKLTDERIRVVIKDFPVISISCKDMILKPAILAKLVDQTLRPLQNTSYVELAYDFDVPFPFKAASKTLRVSARSEVLSGTGCKSRIHRRS